MTSPEPVRTAFAAGSDSRPVPGAGRGALDPRVHLLSALSLALWVSLVPAAHVVWLAPLALALLALLAAAGLPPHRALGRALVVASFAIVPASLGLLTGVFDGRALGIMSARAGTAALVGVALITTTPMPRLLAAASALRVPDALVQVLAMTHRYLLVLRARAAALMVSAQARGFGPRSPHRIATAGNMVGALLVRSLDRAERVHRSMMARGYTGRLPTAQPLAFRAFDAAVLVIVVASTATTLVLLRLS